MTLESKLRRAKKYLAERKIAATAPDSELAYTNSAGQKCQRPQWLKKEESPIVLDNVKAIRGKA